MHYRTLAAHADLPHALYRAEQARHFDQLAQTIFGVAENELMERAGLAAWVLLRQRWPQARRIGIVCGSGNNGGDGYVLARWAQQAGFEVWLGAVGAPTTPAAQAAAQAWLAAGGSPANCAVTALPTVDVWVDALFGIGLSRPVSGAAAALIAALNTTGRPVLALDIHSGIHADTGAEHGIAVHAQVTLSFIALKQGLCTGAAPAYTGSLRFASLELPARVYAAEPLSARRLTWAQCAVQLPPRSRIVHKGDCGRVLVIGGQPGMSGAVLLAGQAALRTGAGLVELATHPSHATRLAGIQPELMISGVATPEELAPLLARADVIALGCGLGTGAWSLALWTAALAAGKPIVLDADGLNLLAQQPQTGGDWILTPHPREAARLLDTSTAAVQADRYAALADLCARFGGVAVLKGAGTLVHAARAQPPGVCNAGNPGMASGGMGDALTGIIASLWAQGLTAVVAAELGVCLHAASADLVAARSGERGLLASDVITALPEVLGVSGG